MNPQCPDWLIYKLQVFDLFLSLAIAWRSCESGNYDMSNVANILMFGCWGFKKEQTETSPWSKRKNAMTVFYAWRWAIYASVSTFLERKKRKNLMEYWLAYTAKICYWESILSVAHIVLICSELKLLLGWIMSKSLGTYRSKSIFLKYPKFQVVWICWQIVWLFETSFAWIAKFGCRRKKKSIPLIFFWFLCYLKYQVHQISSLSEYLRWLLFGYILICLYFTFCW